MDRSKAESGLKMLCEALEDREREIVEYSTSPTEFSDDEADAECTAFDIFYGNGGSNGILNMTNYTPVEFRNLWNRIQHYVIENWKFFRGRNRL